MKTKTWRFLDGKKPEGSMKHTFKYVTEDSSRDNLLVGSLITLFIDLKYLNYCAISGLRWDRKWGYKFFCTFIHFVFLLSTPLLPCQWCFGQEFSMKCPGTKIPFKQWNKIDTWSFKVFLSEVFSQWYKGSNVTCKDTIYIQV